MRFSNASLAVPLFAAAMLTAAPLVAADTAPAQTQTDKSTAPQPKPTTKAEKTQQPASTEAKKTDKNATETTPGATQEAAKPRVSVNVAAVRDSLATQLSISAPLIPDVIMAEPEVAAEACSLAANDLEADLKGDGLAKCTAITTSQSLRVAVQKTMAEKSTSG